jgi:hypothetical protein
MQSEEPQNFIIARNIVEVADRVNVHLGTGGPQQG